MRYTNEERLRLIKGYCERTNKSIEEVSRLFTEDKLIEKYGSGDESYLVENPYRTDERGNFVKTRKKNTHLTPKKKKRKK